jgi:hypothetical protein
VRSKEKMADKPSISRGSSEDVANTYEMVREMDDVALSNDSTQEIIVS